MDKKIILIKILIVFATTIILMSLIDLSIIVFPLHLSSSQWVYSTAQQIIDNSIILLLGIVCLVGVYSLLSDIKNKLYLNIKKTFAICSVLYSLGLILILLLFSLSMNSVELTAINNLNDSAENTKTKTTTTYQQLINANQLNSEQLESLELKKDTFIKQVELKLVNDIKQTKTMFFKQNLKTATSLILFAMNFMFIGLVIFKKSSIELKQLKYQSIKNKK